ncbi:MAG: alpha-1,3/1,6-mannosyltransferase ALG2 [bacterium]
MTAAGGRPLRIAFCHPDLGLGGAERLIVDAAQELGSRGHDVDVYTAYYDRDRCFEETKSGAFRVLVRGNWFPRSIGNRAMALCAYMRCLLMALSVCIASILQPSKRYDVVIVDQVSITNLVFRLLCPQTRVLFYCHFPDLLLAKPTSWVHRLYRAPLDALEQASTGMAHRVLVNSEFTRGVFRETFTVLDARGVVPDVLYPAVVIPGDAEMSAMRASWRSLLPPDVVALMTSRPTFLSINRYERKKNIGLAIRALALVDGGKDGGPKPGLVVAGGYDKRLLENVQHLEELKSIVTELELDDRVVFMTSFSDDQRLALLCGCCAVTYTPTNEHFGIVPIETMAAATPVIACDSGGPKESIVHQKTGYLQKATPEAFAEAMTACMGGGRASGEQARARAEELFSRHAFGDALEYIVVSLNKDDRKRA